MTNATGIDIRKFILAKGLNPNHYSLDSILAQVTHGAISYWELDGQIDLEEHRWVDGEDINGSQI